MPLPKLGIPRDPSKAERTYYIERKKQKQHKMAENKPFSNYKHENSSSQLLETLTRPVARSPSCSEKLKLPTTIPGPPLPWLRPLVNAGSLSANSGQKFRQTMKQSHRQR